VADIFSSWRLNQLTIPNRVVRSATWEGLAGDDGSVTDPLIRLTTELAFGQLGLIITGFTFVLPAGRSQVRQSGIHTDAMIQGWRGLTDNVHKAGGLVSIQLVHAGGQTSEGMIGQKPLGPSAMMRPDLQQEVGALSTGQIAQIVEAFAAAAARAKAAGFDAVQIHAAHGYLINQFLSPYSNQRDDQYGGPLNNRARFCYECYQAVRNAVGPDYPVFIKLNSDDGFDGGLMLEDAMRVAAGLSERGIDAIEISGGGRASRTKASARVVRKPEEEGYFLPNAKAIKSVVQCPVIVVGGFRSRQVVENALLHVDAVSMSRPLIRQADLIRQWRQGSRDSSRCISCGQCSKLAVESGLACGQELKKA